MSRFTGMIAVIVSAALLGSAVENAHARSPGRGYSFVGGTARQRATVRNALAASAFDWGLIPSHVTIHIMRGGGKCDASKGDIWLTSAMLAHGRAAWGVVQHEYAHQVDFFLLDRAKRARLERLLHARTWWRAGGPHSQAGAERFASTLSYAYWPSADNTLIRYAHAEATAMPPAPFRRVLQSILGY
jgi:hypothetical protein